MNMTNIQYLQQYFKNIIIIKAVSLRYTLMFILFLIIKLNDGRKLQTDKIVLIHSTK